MEPHLELDPCDGQEQEQKEMMHRQEVLVERRLLVKHIAASGFHLCGVGTLDHS